MTDYNRTTWQNGVTPANAANMNNIEAYLDRVSNTPGVTVNGSVSGSATVYQPFQGAWKIAVVFWNNYKSAAAQTMVLPAAMSTTGGLWIVTELQGGKLEALSGGSAQTFSVLTALALAGGSESPQTYLQGWSQGMCRGGFDTIRITCTSSTASGVALIVGL